VAADRKVIIAVMGIQQGSAATPVAVTADGNAVALLKQVNSPNDGSGNRGYAGIFAIDIPSGATATIVVNYGAFFFDCSIYVYTATGVGSLIATSLASLQTSPASLDLNVAGGGAVVVAAITYNLTITQSYVGVIQDATDNLYGSDQRAVAHYSAGGAESPRTVSVDYTLTSGSDVAGAVAISYAAIADLSLIVPMAAQLIQ